MRTNEKSAYFIWRFFISAIIFSMVLGIVSLWRPAFVSASPEDYEAMGLDMMELNGQTKYLEVVETYEKFAKPDNMNFRFYRELGKLFFGLEILRQKVKVAPDWSKADNYLSIAHHIDPDNLYVIIHLAILHTYTKDHRKAHHYANMYLEKGGQERKKDAETILEKYKYTIIKETRPAPVPGAQGPLGPTEPRSP